MSQESHDGLRNCTKSQSKKKETLGRLAQHELQGALGKLTVYINTCTTFIPVRHLCTPIMMFQSREINI